MCHVKFAGESQKLSNQKEDSSNDNKTNMPTIKMKAKEIMLDTDDKTLS